MKPIRVLVVDDCPAMRSGLRIMLSNEPSIKVAGECECMFAALEQATVLNPDVVLIDASMLECNLTVAAARFREKHPSARLVMLLDHDRGHLPFEMPLGADAYLSNGTSAETLVRTVLAVATGQRTLDSSCAGSFLEQYDAATHELIRRRLGLSDQEVELLRELAAGATNKEIARKMYLSEITVIRKIQRAIAKLGVANKTQAVAEAIRMAIIS